MKDGEEASALTPAELALAEEGLAAFGALLAVFDREYERLKAERSAADFEDLELRALELLRRDGPVRDAWRVRFAHVMVDEFQDTNRVQLALSMRCVVLRRDCSASATSSSRSTASGMRTSRSSGSGDARRRPTPPSRRSRFAATFAPARTCSPPWISSAPRSSATIVAAGGRPRARWRLARRRARGGAPPDLTHDAEGRGNAWRADEIELQPPPAESNPAYVAEARFLAQRLRALADDGVPRGEMVVLLRAFTHVDAFEEALERAGLSPYVVGGRGYWSQQQVEDALRILGVIANPLDDELLFGALASPACGASPDSLWLLRHAALDPDGRPGHVWPTIAEEGWSEEMPAADARRLREFRATLEQLRSEAPLHPLDALIDRAISAFNYDLAILALPNGERRMANLRKLMRLAAEYEEHDGRDLRGFIDFAQERTRRDEREGMAAVQVEGHDGVRVMTVHAAKGLEFPVVAVADLGRAPTAGSRAPDIALGRLPAEVGDPDGARFGMRLPVAAGDSLRLWELVELCEEDEREQAAESLRLTYVAATRAQRRLILSGAPRDPIADSGAEASASRPWSTSCSPRSPNRLVAGRRGSGAALRSGNRRRHRSRPGAHARVRIQRPSPDRAVELRRRWPARSPALEPSDEPAAPLLPAPMRAANPGHLSYSALADYAGCGYRFYVERVLGLASPLSAGADRRRGGGRRRRRGGRRADRPGARIARAVAGDRQLRPCGARAKRPQLVGADLRGRAGGDPGPRGDRR